MGRGNKSYYKDLHQQAYDKFKGMQAFGESKKAAMANGTDREKIFSYNTYQTYWKHTKYFIHYVKEKHPECTTLKSAQKYANEWLQSRVDQGLSAWTVQTEAKALGKLYGIRPDDPKYFVPPKREREEITRSRGERVRDQHFSKANNDELIRFCRGTGLRRSELAELRGKDLLTRAAVEANLREMDALKMLGDKGEQLKSSLQDALKFNSDYYLMVRNGKGGRVRVSPVVGKDALQIVTRMQGTGREEKVWQHINSNADIHGYRSEYATQIYKMYARDIKSIPYDGVNKGTGRRYQKDVYVCRKDESGKKLDRAAMIMASKALGHNRECVVADNYIRGL